MDRNAPTMHAIRIHQTGEPEVMKYEALPIPELKPDEVLVKIKAIGVNFIDIYIRSGLYPHSLPLTLGMEGAGIVDAVGRDVKNFKSGDRVAWSGIPGSYASHLVARAERLVPLPANIDFEQAAAAMLQGMTAHYLVQGAYQLKKGDTCLVHAAAGGVGLLLCQVAKMLGALVIGTVSSDEKAKLAREAGADEIIVYTREDFVTKVKKITKDKGVNVVYDAVGKDTFYGSLDSLAIRGMLVSYGQASGKIAPLDVGLLIGKSLFLTRPSLFDYTATREELLQRANEVFAWIISGKLTLKIDDHYSLQQAAEAHHALAGRKTTGKVLLIP